VPSVAVLAVNESDIQDVDVAASAADQDITVELMDSAVCPRYTASEVVADLSARLDANVERSAASHATHAE